jgi:hypothetical protein
MSFIENAPRNHDCVVQTDPNVDECFVFEVIPVEHGVLPLFRELRCVFCGEVWTESKR